jgi:hypothetical protein
MHCDAKKQVLRCYSSNLIPTTAHVDLTWSMGFDLSPLDTIASKKRRHAQVIPEKRPTVFAHARRRRERTWRRMTTERRRREESRRRNCG